MRKILINIVILLTISGYLHAYDAVSLMSMMADGVEEGPVPSKACSPGAMFSSRKCDLGAGLLCVNTPQLSVVENHVFVRGTIDESEGKLSSLTVAVQNEYTKEYKQYKLESAIDDEDCWSSDSDFCFSKEGYFSVKALLGEKLGPYTISVAAARAGGQTATENVRTSRVTTPKISMESLSFNPDPFENQVMVKGIQLSIDLLGDCTSCDFVGVSTSGVDIFLTNTITLSDGSVKQVSQKTNVAQAGLKYSVCMPVSNGKNNIHVTACNAATGYDQSGCSSINVPTFSVNAGEEGISWMNQPKLVYTAGESIDLSFGLAGHAGLSCEETDVGFSFNRGTEEKLCASADGAYSLHLNPEPGINIGVIRDGEDDEYTFTFGYGDIVSPFTDTGAAKEADDLWINNAGGFIIKESFMTEDLRTLINNYLKSDEIQKLLDKLPEMLVSGGKPDADSGPSSVDLVKAEIPHCADNGGASVNNQGFELAGKPKIRFAEIPSAAIGQDEIKLVLDVEDLEILLRVFLDNDFDGVSDNGATIPLKISFKKIFAPITLKTVRSGDKPLFLITGEATDCDYRPNNACEHRPAILSSKYFFGGASPSGNFVICNFDDPGIDEHGRQVCYGLNIGDSTSGQITNAVLDTLNKKIYCDGSAVLTDFLRESMKGFDFKFKPFAEGLGDSISNREWELSVGMDLLTNQFRIGSGSVSGTVPMIIGSPEFFGKFDAKLKNPNVGFIEKPYGGFSPEIISLSGKGVSEKIGLSVSERLINALLFVLANQDPVNMTGGVFDWDIHEVFFNRLGFDYVKECDYFKPKSSDDVPPPLCNLRPRVGEILGASLTSAGYFEQKDPLLMRVRGNRELVPHVTFFEVGGKQFVDVQIGGIEFTFYALKLDMSIPRDRFGNPTLLLDSKGEPIIESMNPSDPDPENGPIIKFRMSAQLALELGKIQADPEDPSQASMTIRPDSELTRIVFTPIPMGNATIIKDASLYSAFEEKLRYAINIYSKPGSEMKFSIPKTFEFEGVLEDQFTVLGLERIAFDKDGLRFEVDKSQEYLNLFVQFLFSQALEINGQKQKFTIPH